MEKDIDRLISIVVPIYNVDRYIDRCVETLLHQTYENIEVILIDDGSTDSSGAICDNLAMNDFRIKVIHKPNSGVSSARNAGLDVAQGKYVAFVDPDDYVSATMIEEMLNGYRLSDSDLVCCKRQLFSDTEAPHRVYGSVSGTMSSLDAIKHFLLWDGEITSFVWDKLYKRELLQDIRFSTELMVGEDSVFVFEYLRRCSAVHIVDSYLYYYYLRADSAIGNSYSEKRKDSLIAAKTVYEIAGGISEISNDWAKIHVALDCFFVFSDLLDAPNYMQKYKVDYYTYKEEIRNYSPSLIFKYKSKKMCCLWTTCWISPRLYGMTKSFRSRRRR